MTHEPDASAGARLPGLALLLVCLPLTLFALGFGVPRLLDIRRAEAGTRTTIGIVESASVEALPCFGMCKGGPSFRPQVSYRYEVGGRAYPSGAVTSTNDAGSASWAADIVERHPPRSRTVVHYRPTDPAVAYLEPMRPWRAWTLVILPLVIASAFGVAMARANRVAGGPAARG